VRIVIFLYLDALSGVITFQNQKESGHHPKNVISKKQKEHQFLIARDQHSNFVLTSSAKYRNIMFYANNLLLTQILSVCDISLCCLHVFSISDRKLNLNVTPRR
jgi:hypothetical protein